MSVGIPLSNWSPGSKWTWPPARCFDTDEDYYLAIEFIETDPESY